jgi:hypothetical protein
MNWPGLNTCPIWLIYSVARMFHAALNGYHDP